MTISNQTIRQIVRVSAGGDRIRVVLSNAFGTAPVEIGAAHVALREKDSMVKAASVKPLTFGGATTGKILPGATIVSDPVEFSLAPASDLVVDVFLPGDLGAEVVERDGGRLKVDAERRTSLTGVWAGGDCVAGGKDLTVAAVEDGKQAALSIDRTLRARTAARAA